MSMFFGIGESTLVDPRHAGHFGMEESVGRHPTGVLEWKVVANHSGMRTVEIQVDQHIREPIPIFDTPRVGVVRTA